MAQFDFYVHGLWILGAFFFFLAALISGNLEFVEGANELSFFLAVLLAFALYLVAGMLWISASVNARNDEKHGEKEEKSEEKTVYADAKHEEKATKKKDYGC